MKRWLAHRLEYVLATVALVAIAALVSWWSIFFQRLVAENALLRRELATVQLAGEPGRLAEAVAQVDERSRRLVLMIAGETSVFIGAVTLSVLALFVVARRRKQARQRMERLLQFTSHELKTPVAGVRALLQSLTLGSIPAEQRDRFVNLGIAECDRLEHLVETILAYQRAIARTPQEHLRSAAVAELVEEVLAHRAGTGITEAVRTEGLDGTVVRVDKDGFRVILENLLDNARKYAVGKEVTVTSRVDGRRWLLSVKDQGPGFEPQLAAVLFDPFRRSKHAGVTHGSGLGLFIAKQLAVQMGGDLSAWSDGTGKGATFVLALRLGAAAVGR